MMKGLMILILFLCINCALADKMGLAWDDGDGFL